MPLLLLLHIITLVLLVCSAPVSVAALDSDPLVNSDSGHELIARGEYEKGLEHLRRAYQMFPLNKAYKHSLVEGYVAYGQQLLLQKRYEQADENFALALELYPEEAAFSLLRGICNYHLKKYDLARHELEAARSRKPDSVDTLYYLGLVLYETDNRPQAMELWQEGLKLAPGRKALVEVLERSRKEMAVESGMDRGHSSRFDLSYDPGVDESFALALLDVLENAANQVGAELGYFPRPRVPVVIYKRDDYKFVTDSPDWSGGVFDGSIRLPFGAMKEVSAPMRAVLFHEYAHVVVFELTRGNCPLWLNEGIAEMFGRKQFSRTLAELEGAARKRSLVDFRKLERGFGALATPDANLAYQQSYSLVNYLVTSYGWHRVIRILTALGEGMKVDDAVAEAFKDYSLTYAALQQEWRDVMERGTAAK